MAFFDLKSTIFHYFSLNFTKFRLNIPIFGIKLTKIGDFRSKFGNLGFGIFDPPPFPGKSFGIWHFPAGIFRARGGDNLAFGILAQIGSTGTCPPVATLFSYND